MVLATPTPFAQLTHLVATAASGEFIVAGDEVEVHVFLQAGRVAWATTSAERFVFRRYLIETLGVDAEALQTVFEDCQRTRRPLGEALVAWNLATAEQVREALRAQVVASLASLERCRTARALFLPRGQHYATYDVALTFELESLRPPEPPVDGLGEAVESLLATFPGLRWAGVLEGRREVHVAGAPEAHRAVALANRVSPEVPLLAVRSSGGALVGGLLPGTPNSLWCGQASDAALGPVLEFMVSRLVGVASGASGCVRGGFETFGETEHDGAALQEILERAECPVGAVVLEGAGSPDLWVTARAPLDPVSLGRRAALHQAVLDLDVFEARPVRPAVAGAGLPFQSALVADGRWWWFGTDLATRTQSSLWLALPRAAALGLGWALLSTLARRIASEGESNG